MKPAKFACLLMMGLALSIASGCKTKPQGVQTIYGHRPERVADDTSTRPLIPTAPDQKPDERLLAMPDDPQFTNYKSDDKMFAANTVYFDFDSSAVKSSEKAKIASVADFWKANKVTALRVEGHADERGTEEYNRSLGERRALALREELVRNGVDQNRVVTMSYGEDRPADPGHNDAAWQKNRRGEFILLTPPQ